MTTGLIAVIGSGPAGSTAARILAGRGARVTLFEAQRLPRRKACGGGLTPKAQRLVPFDIGSATAQRVHKAEIRGGRLGAVCMAAREAEIAMVDRATFDMAMADAASVAGAEVRDGERVDTVVEDDRGVTLGIGTKRVRADMVVVADGDPSGISHRLGLSSRAIRYSLALVVDVPTTPAVSPDTAILSLAVDGGYAWYFPKGDHANAGVISSRTSSPGAFHKLLRPALLRLLGELGIEENHDRPITGHWVPQALRRGRLATRRVILVGDAAAVADPLFGEGISFAMRSGAIACEAITDVENGAAADLRPFETRLRETLNPPMRRLRFAAAVAERSPTVALAALRLSPWVRAYAVDAVSGRRHPFSLD